MGGKDHMRSKGKPLLGIGNKLLKTETKFFDITQQCFAILLQVNFPASTFLIFTEVEGDGIKSMLSS